MNLHVIVCGYGRVGRNLVAFLQEAGTHITIVDRQVPSELDDRSTQENNGIQFIQGDCTKTSTLLAADLLKATAIFIVTSEDLVNIAAAITAKQLQPDLRVIVRMFNQNLLKRFTDILPGTQAFSVSALTAPLLVDSALATDRLATLHVDNEARLVGEIPIREANLSLSTSRKFAQYYGLAVIGRERQGHWQPWTELNTDEPLELLDKLIVYGSPAVISALSEPVEEELAVRMAGCLRRFYRAAKKALSQMDLTVKLGSLILFLTLFLGTLVFRYYSGYGWAEAFYQTTSITTTGASLRAEDRSGPEKVFVSMLKLGGAAIFAGFTALLTQYFVRLKFANALDAGRIPDQGHVVVCGLGNVGFRVVEELHRREIAVVAIEIFHDSPFAATVRRMGIPVILGDASVPEVLRQARCESARAVITTSESELLNLEIALLVRELDEEQRVVVRLNDAQFASALRESARIKQALALPSLAAPAFAASLWGNEILSWATIRNRTYAIVRLNLGQRRSHIRQELSRFAYLPIDESINSLTVMIEAADVAKVICLTPIASH